MKLKLLVITSTFPRWQNDTDPPFVYELSKRLADTFDVTVHTPHYPGSLRDEHMGGVRIHRFRYFFSPFERLAGGQGIVPKIRRNKLYYLLLPFFLLSQLFSLILLVVKNRPDVIHAHWLIPQGCWGIVVKKMFNVPVLITAHGTDVFSLRIPFAIVLKKWVVKNADRVVTVSSSLARLLAADTQCQRYPEIISMGVDCSLFSPNMRDEAIRRQYSIYGPFLLFVGRLSEIKGVHILVDAMSLVTKTIPDAKLLIVGRGELDQELRQQVQYLNLESNVVFAGAIVNTELPIYYASAEIFVSPSVKTKDGSTEGFGLTLVEAIMSGCLVIGTKVGGIEDIVEDGQTGFLVSPNDANVLSEKIISLINKKEDFKKLKNQARQTISEKFDWDIVVKKYKKLIVSCSE